MTTIYDIFVSGVPKAQPRPRMTRNRHVYNPSSADAWKAVIESQFVLCRRPTITTPVQLAVVFYLPWSGSRKADPSMAPHGKKPDTDNLLKAVMDSMTVAGVWRDDSLVYLIEAKKLLSQSEHGARITVRA